MFLAIVPAWNEEKTIGRIVRNLLTCVDQVVVVDDGSVDSTSANARAAGAVVLSHLVNRGQGAALETGHTYARKIGADFVLHFDADEQFSIDDITPAKAALEASGADILFGSRFMGKHANLPFLKRYLILPVGHVIQKYLFGIDLKDAHNGFRILTKRALKAVYITQDKMAHATEIPVLAIKYGLRYIEFPVTVTYYEYGQGVMDGVGVVADLVTGKLMQK